MTASRPTWAEVDLASLRHNARLIGRQAAPRRWWAVVKADGYGHGAVQVARVAAAEGALGLCVATPGEALELRQAGLRLPVLVLGWTPPEAVEAMIQADVRLTVFDLRGAEEASRAARRLGRPARIHLKVDTGMTRLGFDAASGEERLERAAAEAARAALLEGVEAEGVFTHLASSESDREASREQLERFGRFLAALAEEGVRPRRVHAGNSGGLFHVPEARPYDYRVGIALYGYGPAGANSGFGLGLRPALRWRARVAQVREVPAGRRVSYGGTFVTSRPSRLATLPVGYADGLHRALSGRGTVLLRGRRAPMVGRVCMDQVIVDATDIPGVEAGDVATLIGEDGGQRLTADDVAEAAGTISYEVLTSISGRVPRRWAGEGDAGGAPGRAAGGGAR
ncbi:MAG: alanine racemase [Bacillota bacterium]|nr:alanine racemase [Bacillota bacterium]